MLQLIFYLVKSSFHLQVSSLQSSLDVALGRIAELESAHRSSGTSKVFREPFQKIIKNIYALG